MGFVDHHPEQAEFSHSLQNVGGKEVLAIALGDSRRDPLPRKAAHLLLQQGLVFSQRKVPAPLSPRA